MALSAETLTTALMEALLNLPVDPTNTEGDKWFNVMSQAQQDKMEANISAQMTEIINHITENAVVTVAMVTHTHSGVTTGAGVSGPPVPGTSEEGSVSTVPPGGIT